jgi:hypothetical protein
MDKKSNEKLAIEPRVPFTRELLPEEGNRRQRLAAWVTDPKNPYFARAAVNRVWALMLGRPLVAPVDNLESAEQGMQQVPLDDLSPGEKQCLELRKSMLPILQLLADDFTASGFDLRRLIRVIACTRVFRLDSAVERDSSDADEESWAIFPLTRLRPEQVVGGAIQTSSVSTINAESHIVIRILRLTSENDFVKRYGDSGEDEFGGKGGTIPQRLLMMNGNLIHDRIKDSIFNAATRIAWQAPDDPRAVETAYLSVLTRRPTEVEAKHFEQFLGEPGMTRPQKLEDLFWALINSTEFSWNH